MTTQPSLQNSSSQHGAAPADRPPASLAGSPAAIGLLAGAHPGLRGPADPKESLGQVAAGQAAVGQAVADSSRSDQASSSSHGQHSVSLERQHGPGLQLSPACARLPVALSVTVPVREFRVRTLLAMALGEIVETQWGHGEDLPLSSGDVQVAWSEFEVVDTRLAVRVTRLA